jgi:hypothetical protein
VKIKGLDMPVETLAISRCALNSKASKPKEKPDYSNMFL